MKEFKVKQQSKNETVYTLESASAGGTSSGAIASVSKPLGGVQRRNKDNLLVGEEGSGDPTIEQMTDEELANFLGVPVKLVTDNREHAEEVARDKASDLSEAKKPGLWANIHAKRKRIKGGSGEHMRKPGSKGAPTAQAFKDAAKEGKEQPKLNAPRNPVAHAHQKVSGGSGSHKDKSKVIPRKEKYKNKDLAESTYSIWQAVINALSAGAPDLDPADSLENLMNQYNISIENLNTLAKHHGYDSIYDVVDELSSHSVDESYKDSAYYHEKLAHKVFAENPSASSANEIVSLGYIACKNDLGRGHASQLFKYEPNFINDFIEAYYQLQKEEVNMESTTLKEGKDHEGSMARSELYRNIKYGISMLKMVRPGQQIEGWVQSCLIKAANGLDKVYHYLDYRTHNGDSIDQSSDLDGDIFEDGDEANTALESLMLIVEYSMKLYKMIKDGDDLEGWIFMKLTNASECVSSAKHHLEFLHFKEFGMDDGFKKSMRKNMFEGKEMSKQEVINWFVSHGKTAAQGAAAYERGWKGPEFKLRPSGHVKKNDAPVPKEKWSPYKDDSDYATQIYDIDESASERFKQFKDEGKKILADLEKKWAARMAQAKRPNIAEGEFFDPVVSTFLEDWQKVNRKDKTSGMSQKAVKAYRREHPGSKLKTAVTTKPSKLKKDSKASKRRKSFCARMKGMKKSRASAKTKRDPNSNINKALRRWNCEE